jgi:hypothetical protein
VEPVNLSTIDTTTHILALAIVLIVSAFIAAIFTGAVLYERTAKNLEGDKPELGPDPDPAEIDTTYYPDDDEVIFRR